MGIYVDNHKVGGRGPRGYPASVNGVSPDNAGNIILTPAVIGAATNLNLLDNAYFLDSINQRGKTEYTTAYSYTIDRWINGTGKLELTEQGLIISPQGHPQQVLEDYIANTIKGRLVTISLLCADNTLHKTSAIFPQNNDPFYASDGYIIFELAINDLGKSYIAPRNSSDENKIFVAAKLELGPIQTLAHQDAAGNWVLNDPPPNKALELLKCQRYYQRFSLSSHMPIGTSIIDGAKNLQIPFKLNVPMRCAPTVKFDGGMRASGTEVNYITVTSYETGFSDDFSIAVFNFNFGDISGASQFIPITLDAYPYLTIEFDAEL